MRAHGACGGGVRLGQAGRHRRRCGWMGEGGKPKGQRPKGAGTAQPARCSRRGAAGPPQHAQRSRRSIARRSHEALVALGHRGVEHHAHVHLQLPVLVLVRLLLRLQRERAGRKRAWGDRLQTTPQAKRGLAWQEMIWVTPGERGAEGRGGVGCVRQGLGGEEEEREASGAHEAGRGGGELYEQGGAARVQHHIA